MDDIASAPALIAAQYRAARAMIGWSLLEASQHARVSVATIVAIEKGHLPPSVDRGGLIAAAYGAAGVEFFRHRDAFGLRLRSSARPLVPGPSSNGP